MSNTNTTVFTDSIWLLTLPDIMLLIIKHPEVAHKAIWADKCSKAIDLSKDARDLPLLENRLEIALDELSEVINWIDHNPQEGAYNGKTS